MVMVSMWLVEDSDVSRHLLQCMLSRLGQTDIVESNSCVEAISLVKDMRQTHSFDVVFLDLASTD